MATRLIYHEINKTQVTAHLISLANLLFAQEHNKENINATYTVKYL